MLEALRIENDSPELFRGRPPLLTVCVKRSDYRSITNVDEVLTWIRDWVIARRTGLQFYDLCAEADASNRGIKDISLAIEDGDPGDRIVECATRENADLIVLGRRGLGQLKELFIGSVSHKVSQLAPCACLTVT